MTEPYPTKIHWHCGLAFHLDGRITYLTEKDLNPHTTAENLGGFDLLLHYVGESSDPDILIDHLRHHLSAADVTELTQRGIERGIIALNSDGYVVPVPRFAYHRSTPLPEVKFTPLPGAKETPAGHHAHFDYMVKSWPWFFEPMCAGEKKHDMRDKRDRDYKVGDQMLLREFDPRTGTYTGREAVAMITYITDNVTPCAMSSAALANDFAILSVTVSELGDTDRNA